MEQIVSFPGLGIEEFIIDRVAFSIGGLKIYWYGILIALAFMAAFIYVQRRAHTFGVDNDRSLDVLLGAVIGGIVGARLYYVAFSWETYKDDLLKIFNTREGGIAIYGGIIGGFLVAWLLCRWRRVKFLPLADATVAGLILAQSIGRWGNFVNVEAFGTNTSAPWGMAGPSIAAYLQYHQDALAAQGIVVDPSMPVHPTFFYESVWCLIGFLVLALYTKRRRFDGELVLIYGAWYGAGRMLIEGLRTDSLMWGSVRVSQALAALLLVVCAVALLTIRRKIRENPDAPYAVLYVNTEEGQAVVRGEFYKKPQTQDTADIQTEVGQPQPSSDVSESEEMTDESKVD